MEFIHSVLAQDETVVAGTVVSYDLPVNPLSHILLTLAATRTAAGTNALPLIINLINCLTRIEVLYKGSAIFSMSGMDAVAAGIYVHKFESWGVNFSGIIAEETSFTIPIPLGRTPYNAAECFPRSMRGELILQLTYAAVLTDQTLVRAQIETIELPEAAPERYLRMTTLSRTFPAAGENDIELPIGNPISDVVLWGGAISEGAVFAVTLGYLQILVDNQRRFYSHTNYETHHNMAGRMRPAPGYWYGHTHFAAAGIGISHVIADDHLLQCYSHLPFDIHGDLEYALQTAGKSDIVLRIGVDAGAASLAVRVIPCEIVPASAGV